MSVTLEIIEQKMSTNFYKHGTGTDTFLCRCFLEPPNLNFTESMVFMWNWGQSTVTFCIIVFTSTFFKTKSKYFAKYLTVSVADPDPVY
jgi:hypothetical protein